MSRSGGEATISVETVREKTGKTWEDWFAILDDWNAPAKGHKLTARYLTAEWKLSPWWAQTVTVRYEQSRDLRAIGQRSGGKFAVSLQRTFSGTPEQALRAFTDQNLRGHWLWWSPMVEIKGGERARDAATGQRVETPIRLRLNWENAELAPESVVEVRILVKPSGGVTVQIEHNDIRDEETYQVLKERWGEALNRLKSDFEKS